MKRSTSYTAWHTGALIIIAAYCAVMLTLDAFPFPDLPNHISRAYIMSHIGTSPELAKNFLFAPRFIPYFFSDWMLALVLRVVDIWTAGVAWMTALFLFFIFSVWFYLLRRGEDDNECLLILLLSPYFATSYFYLSGYHAYCFSIGLAFLTLGFWESWQRELRSGKAAAHFAAMAVLTPLTYSAHLAGFFFLGAILGFSAFARLLLKKISLYGAALSVTPCAILALYHAGGSHLGASAGDLWIQRSFVGKFLAASGMFIRFNYPMDISLMVLFVALPFVLVAAGIGRIRLGTTDRKARLAELAVVITGLIVCYLVLPADMPPALEVDLRAEPFLCLYCCLLAFGSSPRELLSRSDVRGWCFGISLLNLVYLSAFWLNDNAYLSDYLAALEHVPPKSTLISVNTKPTEGRLDVGTHHAELYSVVGLGVSPEIFADNTSKDQFSYFRYQKDWYSPGRFWYARNEDDVVLWEIIAQQYRYLIVNKPFDPARLPMHDLRSIFSNAAAEVFEIEVPTDGYLFSNQSR